MSTWNPTSYDPDDFANRRHIGPSPTEMETMLSAIGVGSLDELIDQAVPTGIRQTEMLSWAPLTEGAVLEELRRMAAKNKVRTSMIGQGYHGTITPPAIQRNIRPEVIQHAPIVHLISAYGRADRSVHGHGRISKLRSQTISSRQRDPSKLDATQGRQGIMNVLPPDACIE